MTGRLRWIVMVAAMLLVIGASAGVAALLNEDAPSEELAASGGPSARLPPPQDLAELVATSDVIVIGRVSRVFDPREEGSGPSQVTVGSYELTVVEYLKGSGPATIVVRQVVSEESAEGLAYAMTVPGEGIIGFFFLSPELVWGEGGYRAFFGPDGRVIDAAGGSPALDRPERPPVEFLAGKTMADIDREIRALVAAP